MKLLFVGEGPHDIGHPDFNMQPRPAGGVVFALCQKVCPEIGKDSVALAWKEIPRLIPAKKGLEGKVAAALMLAKRKFQCDGAVFVHDRDGDKTRLNQLESGIQRGREVTSHDFKAICGTAVETIEAWTLGAQQAIALVLGCDIGEVQGRYKLGHVEQFSPNSGKPEHRSKDILDELAKVIHQEGSTSFRELVAEQTDIDQLANACPQGFGPFVASLKKEFGVSSPANE